MNLIDTLNTFYHKCYLESTQDIDLFFTHKSQSRATVNVIKIDLFLFLSYNISISIFYYQLLTIHFVLFLQLFPHYLQYICFFSILMQLKQHWLFALFQGQQLKIQMKKVPSYPKITTKPLTAPQTHTININSPKAVIVKKGFKNQNKKTKTLNSVLRDDSAVNLLKHENKKLLEPARKSSKKGTKQAKQIVNEKSIKSSKSQRQLLILSQKLKKLEEKIKRIKQKEKMEKLSSNSHRSLSKNRQNSSYVKREASSSRKQIGSTKKYLINRAQSHKALKKSYSDKLQFEVPVPTKTKKKSEVLKSSKYDVDERYKQKERKKQQKEHHDAEVIHQFVTQVPNTHPHNLKQSVQKSLANNHYAITPSNQSEMEQQEQQETELYYIGKAIKSLLRPALYPIRQHLIQSLQTLQFLQNIKKPSSKQLQKKQVTFSHSKFRHTVVLDLDQTLIHCNESVSVPHDVKLNIKFPNGERIDAGVNIRPFAKQFLHQLAEICQIVVFTASHECYATVVLDHLDPKRQYISHRLFRQHCWQTQEGIYIKDLRVMKNRSLENTILVDNAAYSYFFQMQNGVPIVPYYDDKEDKQLMMLLGYIKQTIAHAQKSSSSLRKLNEKYFKLIEYSKFEDIGPLVEELYSTDNSSQGA